jgi:hypothetical protein
MKQSLEKVITALVLCHLIPRIIQVIFNMHVKVSKFQKQIFLFSFPTKNE